MAAKINWRLQKYITVTLYIYIGNVCDLSDQVGERTSVVAIYAESCGKAVTRRSWRSIAELVPAAG